MSPGTVAPLTTLFHFVLLGLADLVSYFCVNTVAASARDHVLAAFVRFVRISTLEPVEAALSVITVLVSCTLLVAAAAAT